VKTETVGHTPGPWSYVQRERRNGVKCVVLTEDGYERLRGEWAEMLETLKSIAIRASCAPNDDEERAGAEFAVIMNYARAAIAKAEGRSA
jgi:hypothetical protein